MNRIIPFLSVYSLFQQVFLQKGYVLQCRKIYRARSYYSKASASGWPTFNLLLSPIYYMWSFVMKVFFSSTFISRRKESSIFYCPEKIISNTSIKVKLKFSREVFGLLLTMVFHGLRKNQKTAEDTTRNFFSLTFSQWYITTTPTGRLKTKTVRIEITTRVYKVHCVIMSCSIITKLELWTNVKIG